jgi:predicted amidohydrolase YtcJ
METRKGRVRLRRNAGALQAAGAGPGPHNENGARISDADAIKWLTYNPAKALGIAGKTGSLKAGKMADLVLWNGNPLSVYARPDKVWIDGALMFDASNPKIRPVSDFELGQLGEGDVK